MDIITTQSIIFIPLLKSTMVEVIKNENLTDVKFIVYIKFNSYIPT